MKKLSLLFALFMTGITIFSCMQDAPSEVPKGILKITSPLANDNFAIGDTVHIQADAVMLEMSKVDFFVDGALKGSDANAPYNFDLLTAGMTVDKHIIKAISYGEGGCIEQSVSINLAVGVPPVVNVTSPADGAFIELGTNYNITATATDSDGTITEVRFYINDVLKNTDTTFPYSYSWNTAGLTVGSYIIKIIAKDNRIEESEKSITANLAIKPTVTTAAISNISYTTAIGGGNVTDIGGASVTTRGVCWSTDGLPVVSGSHTIDGMGAGAFVSSLSGLTDGIRYIVRAYATNSIGTSYGDTISFRTLEVTAPAGFRYVFGRTFCMGSTTGSTDEVPVHSVTLSSFYIGKYEVTQAEWVATMGSNPSYFTGNLQRPVEKVSWYDILVYCNKRSIAEDLTPCYTINGSTNPTTWGTVPVNNTNAVWDAVTCNWAAKGYRLPTEAEWEYAARGGNNSLGYTYSGSNTIDDVAWYSTSSGTHTVGTKDPNELGIYDMSGNVEEWNWDWYASYTSNAQTNPTGPSSGLRHVIRNGSWSQGEYSCRFYCRNHYAQSNQHNTSTGFRLVRSP